MKKSHLVAIVSLVVIGLLVYSASYTVKEFEQVVIVRFGEVIGAAVTEPGLKFKIPFIEEAQRFDKRWLEWDGDANQITTLDKRYIYIDVFARWRIAKPLVFIETLRDERSAQGRLDDIIDNATRNVVANHKLIEAIRSTSRRFEKEDVLSQVARQSVVPALPDQQIDRRETEEADGGPGKDEAVVRPAVPKTPERARTPETGQGSAHEELLYAIDFGRERLTRLILEKASIKARQLGIELKDVQVKRVNYIESVQNKVFDRMISERKRVAAAFRSEGRGRSAEILGKTEKELKKIRSEAYKTAQEIMGKADGEAASVYARAYRRDPEFYNFLKTLESYQETVDENSWLILSTDADYARHFRTMKKAPR